MCSASAGFAAAHSSQRDREGIQGTQQLCTGGAHCRRGDPGTDGEEEALAGEITPLGGRREVRGRDTPDAGKAVAALRWPGASDEVLVPRLASWIYGRGG